MRTVFTKAVFILGIVSVFLLSLPALAADGGGKGKGKKPVKKQYRKTTFTDFTPDYYEQKSDAGDPEIERLRAQAKVSVNEVDAQNRYVDFLSPADLNKLPIGLKKRVGNTTVKIAVSSAVFTPRYAELTMFAKIDIPQNNTNGVGSNTSSKTIFFGVKGLKLSKDGGIIGNAKLVLMGDYAIPINGNKSALVLKGGFDINTGQGLDKTYITIDCNGFKELGLQADVEFPRSLLLPTDAQGNVLPTGLVKGSFSTVVSNWNDILASISLPPFEVKGVDGVGFKIDNAVVDLSDYRNSADIVYPAGYQQKYLGNDPNTLKLWRGVYAKEIRVVLPKSFANRDSTNRVAFGSQNMIIDNNGLTGLFYSENIIPLNKGTAGGWQFSVDSFRVALEANRLLRAGFGGRIGLPVNKEATAESEADSIKRRKYLAYSAVMSTTGDYLCRVITKDTMNFDVWKANVMLLPNSYVELAGNKNAFKPAAMLHGRMDLSSKTSTTGTERSTKILDFKGVEFQALHIKTEAPYLTAQYFGYNGAIKIGNLPVSIDSIALKTFAPGELGVGFNLRLNLQDIGNGGFGGKTRLYVVGKYNQEQGLAKWKYDRLKIEDITIQAQIGNVNLNGTIAFLDNDPKYGDGFKGNLTMGVKMMSDSLAIHASAIFGNNGFRYWFVDGLVEFPGSGIPIGPVNFNGFGGGAYYRMKKDGFMQGPSGNTGVQYAPDSTAGLGLRASVVFNVASKNLDYGQATFEVGFNRGGGMRYIGFYGYAKIMSPLKLENFPGGSMVNSMANEFNDINTKMQNQSPAWLDSLATKKIFDPTGAAKLISKVPVNVDVDFRAVLGINYDFNNRIFHANFDLYVSTNPALLTGVGPGGRAGWAVLHIDPAKWYLHMGTPTDPIGIKIGLGPISVQSTAYFMLGHDLPAFPPLPPALQALLNKPPHYINYQSNIDIEAKNKIKEGKGVAFGASIQASTGDMRFLILYANFQAGMGFDVMIKDYSGYHCQETGQTPGINGWYAQGRVYAYLQGEAGVRIKLGPIRKKIPIIKAGAIALLEARLPKPTWVGGLFNINVSLLGNLVRVNVNLKFSFGDNCTLVPDSNGSNQIDFDEFRVVTAVTPGNNAQNVSLFAKPVITCATPPNVAFNLPPDEENGAEETFRPQLTSISFTGGGSTIAAKYKIATNGTSITVSPDSIFRPLTQYTLTVKVNYQKLVSGSWVNVTDNGNPVVETTTVNFTTSDNPPFVDEGNIGFMHPYKNQKYLYRNEAGQGRVLLRFSQQQLFGSFTSWKAKFFSTANSQLVGTTAVTYDNNNRTISYALPAGLQASTAYRMDVMGEGYISGSIVTDTTRPVLQVNFSTSQYGTLTEKLNALSMVQAVVGRVESDVIDLQANVSQYEGFDLAEITGQPLTGNMPLISAEADLTNENYYNTKIKTLLNYPTFYPQHNINISRPPEEVGVVPVKAIAVSSYYITATQGANYNTILFDRLPFIYDLNRVFNADFIELRTKIVNKFLSNMTNAPTGPMYEWYRPCWLCSKRLRMTQEWVNFFNSTAYQSSQAAGDINNIPYEMRPIVTQPFPFMSQGNYKVNFQVRKAVSWYNGGTEAFNYETGSPAPFTYVNPIQ